MAWVKAYDLGPGIRLGVGYDAADKLVLALERPLRPALTLPLSLSQSAKALGLLDPLMDSGGVAESSPDAERRWLEQMSAAVP